MILFRTVIFLALVGTGVWYLLAEPDRSAERAAITQSLQTEADMRQATLSAALRRNELALALIARSATVAALIAEQPAPEPSLPEARAPLPGTGFATPPPLPAPTPAQDDAEEALLDLPSLAALSGLDAIRIRKQQAGQTLPPVPPPAGPVSDNRWQRAVNDAFSGQQARILFVGDDKTPRVALFAPVSDAGEVQAIVIAEADLTDTRTRWLGSDFRLSLTDTDGDVILSNDVAAGDESIAVTRNLPGVNAVIRAAAAGPEPVGPWVQRSGAALVIALLFLLLVEVYLSRRRLQTQLSEAQLTALKGPAGTSTAPAPDQDGYGRGNGHSLALLGKVSDALGREIDRPLSSIRDHAGEASRAVEGGDLQAARQSIGQVSEMADRIGRIIANMRGYVTAQPYQIEPVSIRPVVQDSAVKMLERDKALGDFFFLEVADDVPDKAFVRADKTRLSQVLDSLLVSSWEACREQDQPELVISIQQTPADMVIAIDASGDATQAALSNGRPANGGAGAGSSATGGKGIGFTLAKSVVEGMNGALIGKNSALGGGRIEIILPKFRTNAL